VRAKRFRKLLERWSPNRVGKAVARLRKHWAGRVVTHVIQAIVGLYVAYVVIVNGAMVTGLAEWMANRDPNKTVLHFTSAYSFWPGRVHVNHFVLRGQDSVFQWRIELEDATAKFALTELFAKHVHITWGEASGASLRIRTKLDAKDAHSPAARMLPPIEGFADPPIKGAAAPDPPDSAYPYYTYDIENGTVTNVREVWFDSIHCSDAGEAHGGFYLKPSRRVEVRPSTAELNDASAQEGATIIAKHVRGRVDFRMEPFDPRTTTGAQLVAYIDAKTSVVGTLDSLRFLNLHLAGEPIGFAGGGGPVYASVEMLRGTVLPGSHMKARLQDWQVFSSPHRVSGTTVADVHVDRASEAQGWFESYDVSLRRRRLTVLDAPTVGALAHTKSIDMSKPIADWAASFDVPAGTVPNVSVANMYANKPLFIGGTANVSAHVDVDQDQAHAHGKAAFERTTIIVGDKQFATTGSVALVMDTLDLHTGRGDLTGTSIEVHDLAYGKDKDEGTWWARATVGPGDFALEAGTLNLTLSGKARDAKPAWSLMQVPGWVAGILGGDALTIAGNVRIGPSLFDIPNVHAVGDAFDAQARYLSRGSSTKGVAFLRRGPVTAGVVIDGDDVSVLPLASEAWFRSAASRLQ
jgi:hypothetical protein